MRLIEDGPWNFSGMQFPCEENSAGLDYELVRRLLFFGFITGGFVWGLGRVNLGLRDGHRREWSRQRDELSLTPVMPKRLVRGEGCILHLLDLFSPPYLDI